MSDFWRFTVNGSVVTTPDGWEQASVTIERDPVVKGILYAYSSRVTFYGDGYDELKSILDTSGFCEQVSCLIEFRCEETDTFDTFFDGLILIKDCTFNLTRCKVDCTIEDNTFNAHIATNQQIETSLNADRSKNGDVITPPTIITTSIFNTCTGATIAGGGHRTYKIDDVLQFFIDFMVDQTTMTYSSPAFGAGGDYEGYVLATGAALDTALTTAAPITSFRDLFENLYKKFNVSFYIDTSGADPEFVVDETENIYDTATAQTLTNVTDIELTVDKTKLYSVVSIGSQTTQDDEGGCGAGGFAFPDGQFFGFTDETYNVIENCNEDNKLDLVNSYIIDSNVIHDVAVNSNDDYDTDIFLIETNAAGTSATQYADFDTGAGERVYNRSLTNREVMPRHTGAIPNSIALYLGDGDDEFEATKTAASAPTTFTTLASPTYANIDFTTVVADPNGNYDGTDTYTAPATGVFTFQCGLNSEDINFPTTRAVMGDLKMTVIFQVNGVDRASQEFTLTNPVTVLGDSATISSDQRTATRTLYLDSGDTVDVDWKFEKTGGGALECTGSLDVTTSFFSCIATETGGGIYQEYDPEDVRILLYNFEHPLSHSDFAALLPNNRQKVNFSNADGDINVTGWIESLVYDVNEAVGRWEVSDKNVLD